MMPSLYSMEFPNSSKWTNLDLQELIKRSRELILVAWIGKILSPQDMLTRGDKLGIQARQLKIGTQEVWQQEIEPDCYVVRYHDGTGKQVNYDDTKAVHFTVQDWGAKHGNDPEYQNKIGNILVSAFDTIKNKRIIVDGVHRGAVMSSAYSKDNDYTDRVVYEWYSPNVKEIFPNDFKQFYRNDVPRII
jgi:hypothetical protein